MRMVGPFRLADIVGTCDVGEVWSGADAAGQPVTVAILTGPAAGDQAWRDAFAATAYALSGAGTDGLPIVNADYTATEPWAACADEPGPGAAQIFMALGMQPTPAVATPQSAPPSTSPQPQPQPTVETAPMQMQPTVETAPQTQTPTPAEAAAAPVAQPSISVAGAAATAAAERAANRPATDKPILNQPVLNQDSPTQPLPQANTAPVDPARSPTSMEPAGRDAAWLRTQQPVSGVPLSPYTIDMLVPRPSGRRIALWIAVVAVVALALGVAGGAVGSSLVRGGDDPVVDPTPTENLDLGLPSAPPAQPGVEPPQSGGWPDEWPKFGPGDDTKDMSGLDFSFKAPEGWDCVQKARGSGYAHYTCGRLPEIGGDLIVRHCPAPCNGERRSQMRSAEEAWGVRWTRSGAFIAWGDTKQVNGEARYGLAYVGYFRTERDDRLDRQLVFRMTAPLDQADQLRKVINSIRDATYTS